MFQRNLKPLRTFVLADAEPKSVRHWARRNGPSKKPKVVPVSGRQLVIGSRHANHIM